jgi:hypothetical protein
MIVSSSHTISQTASCPLCHQAGARRLFSSKDRIHNLPGTFELFRCAVCHAIFIQPWLTADELAGYYPKEYGRYRYSTSLEKNKRGRWHRLVRENYYGYPDRKKSYPLR